MSIINMFLQGKGGVGKSFAAILMAQKMIEDGKAPLCIDIDPVNPTLSGYKALNVKRFKIMVGEDVDPFLFDAMFEEVVASKNDVIIDNGASSYIALTSYLTVTNISTVLKEMGHTLVIHTVIIGGNALLETVGDFTKVIASFDCDTKFVVWLNPFFGPVSQDGKEFTEFKAYTKNAERIVAVIEIPEFAQKLHGRDLREMFESKFTFKEALSSSSVPIFSRQRLTMMRRDLWSRMGSLEAIA